MVKELSANSQMYAKKLKNLVKSGEFHVYDGYSPQIDYLQCNFKRGSNEHVSKSHQHYKIIINNPNSHQFFKNEFDILNNNSKFKRRISQEHVSRDPVKKFNKHQFLSNVEFYQDPKSNLEIKYSHSNGNKHPFLFFDIDKSFTKVKVPEIENENENQTFVHLKLDISDINIDYFIEQENKVHYQKDRIDSLLKTKKNKNTIMEYRFYQILTYFHQGIPTLAYNSLFQSSKNMRDLSLLINTLRQFKNTPLKVNKSIQEIINDYRKVRIFKDYQIYIRRINQVWQDQLMQFYFSKVDFIGMKLFEQPNLAYQSFYEFDKNLNEIYQDYLKQNLSDLKKSIIQNKQIKEHQFKLFESKFVVIFQNQNTFKDNDKMSKQVKNPIKTEFIDYFENYIYPKTELQIKNENSIKKTQIDNQYKSRKEKVISSIKKVNYSKENSTNKSISKLDIKNIMEKNSRLYTAKSARKLDKKDEMKNSNEKEIHDNSVESPELSDGKTRIKERYHPYVTQEKYSNLKGNQRELNKIFTTKDNTKIDLNKNNFKRYLKKRSLSTKKL